MALIYSEVMTILVRISTASGSEYLVKCHRDDSWWCSAYNVVNKTSTQLEGTGWWRIAPPSPWPPVIGWPIVLVTPETLRFGDPDRMPGGGKVTSPVIEVVWIERIDAKPISAPSVPS